MNKKTSGFTLFELLVTISIIAILTAVAVVSFGGVNKKARDSRRTADLESIRIALEAYKQINNAYPANLTTLTTGVVYLQKIPVDPKTKVAYPYTPGVAPIYTYSIGTSMEDVGSTNCSSSCGCTGCNYKVVNP